MTTLTPAGPAGARPVAARVVLFGRHDPELQRLYRDPAFGALLAGLGAGPGPEVQVPAVRTLLEQAVRLGVLCRQGRRLAPGPRLLLVPGASERELAELAGPALQRYGEVMAGVVPGLRQAYEECAAARRFPWAEAAHSLGAGLLMDLAVGRRLFACCPELRPGGESVLWALEQPLAANPFGVQLLAGRESGWVIAQLWHRGLERRPLGSRGELAGLLGGLAAGAPDPAQAPGWLHLRWAGLVRRAGRGHELLVPWFSAGEQRRLAALADDGARRLLAEAVLPVLGELPRLPFWAEEAAGRRPAAVRLLLEHAADAVVGRGVLPAFPPAAAASPAWGRWLWNEQASPEARLLHGP